jgi:hypothetical protein
MAVPLAVCAAFLQGMNFTLKWSPADASAPRPGAASAGGGSLSAPADFQGRRSLQRFENRLASNWNRAMLR